MRPRRPELIHAGAAHPAVRSFLAIKKGHDEARGAMSLEGLWLVRKALDAAVAIEAVFACPGLRLGDEAHAVIERAIEAGAQGYLVSERVMTRMVDRDGPDGLAAIGRRPPANLWEIPVDRATRVIVVDSWDLPGNLGTMIRAADGAGADAVLVSDARFRITHPLVLKASMGAALSLPVVAVEAHAARSWLCDASFRIVAADPAAPNSYRDADYRGPLAIVVGNERLGLGVSWRAVADTIVSIPMAGTADSLNAAMAGALLLYEALAQTTTGGPRSLDAQSGPAGPP